MAQRGLTLPLTAALCMVGCASTHRTPGAAPSESVRIEWIGHTTITFDDEMLGGLSGLTYNDGRWFAMSDHPREPRLVELAIEVDPSAQTIGARVVDSRPISAHRDAETVEWIDAHTFAIGFEIPGAVALVHTDAPDVDDFTIPPHIERGLRGNRRFESLALRHAEARSELWAGIETALEQDGPEATPGAGALCRVLVLDLNRSAPHREFVYETGRAPGFLPGASFNSLVGFAPLDDGRILALERSLDPLSGYAATLRLITPGSGETDVANVESLRGAEFVPLRVETLNQFGSLNSLGPGNAEGIAIGPEIEDDTGGRLVILVSDDNFGRDGPRGSLIIALRLLTSAGEAPAPSAPR